MSDEGIMRKFELNMNHKCPGCGVHGVSVFKVMVSDVVGWAAKCAQCAETCSHPNWAKTTITLLTITGALAAATCIARERGTEPDIAKAVMVLVGVLTVNAAISFTVPLDHDY